MKFSLWPHNERTPADLLEEARSAEETGWYGVWLADHYMPNTGDTTPARGEAYECWALLPALAAVTERVRIGTLVSPTSVHHPALLAKRRGHRLALDAEHLARSLETMGLAEMPDYRPQLPALRERIALIAGADDTKYVDIARALPCASMQIVIGSGHDPTLEQPERLAAAIATAVSRLS